MSDGSASLTAALPRVVLARQRTLIIAAAALVVAGLYVAHPPAVPDLAAQVARVNAALFLGIGALAVAIGEPERRRVAIWVAGVLAAAGLTQMVIFPGAGQMPYPWWHMAVSLLTIAAVGAACSNRTVRIGCAIAAAATVFFFLVPSPVGTNMVRLTWLVAAPVAAAAARFKGRFLVAFVL